MIPLSTQVRAAAEGATPGPLALYIVSGGDGFTACLQAGRPGDKYGHENFSATHADAALLSLLRNSVPQIAAALALAEAVDRARFVIALRSTLKATEPHSKSIVEAFMEEWNAAGREGYEALIAYRATLPREGRP